MTILLLIRHAICEGAGERLWGRTAGVHLTEAGHRQARSLALRPGFPRLDAVYTSPLERTRETAHAIAAHGHLVPCLEVDLNEIDYGAWTGRTITELAPDPHWQAFNASRAVIAPPGGESMPAVQARALAACGRIAAQHPDTTVAVVTHGDVIRALLCAKAGITLDRIFEFTVDYATTCPIAINELFTAKLRG